MTRYLIFVLLPALTIAGCRKNAAPGAPEPPAAEEYVTTPAAIIPPEPRVRNKQAEASRTKAAEPPKSLTDAELNFEAGNYRQAAKDFEKFLYDFQNAPARDRALFHLGFSLALSGDDSNLIQTETFLRRLISEFPDSSYRRQAEWILSLKTQVDRMRSDVKDRDERIRQLSDELSRLKSIDLDRRPSRPE